MLSDCHWFHYRFSYINTFYLSEKHRPKEDIEELDAKNKITKDMVKWEILNINLDFLVLL